MDFREDIKQKCRPYLSDDFSISIDLDGEFLLLGCSDRLQGLTRIQVMIWKEYFVRFLSLETNIKLIYQTHSWSDVFWANFSRQSICCIWSTVIWRWASLNLGSSRSSCGSPCLKSHSGTKTMSLLKDSRRLQLKTFAWKELQGKKAAYYCV